MDQDKPAKPVGRPRQNVKGKGDGNPALQIRMPRERLETVQGLGGASWARDVLEVALPKAITDEHERVCHACTRMQSRGLRVHLAGKTYYLCQSCICNWHQLLA